MGKHAKTLELLEVARVILADGHPMTVRQCYYQLVSRQVIENKRTSYQKVSDLLVDARKSGAIPWEWIEDRLRRPRGVAMWGGLADFATAASGWYRRDIWETQPGYVELWLEKDALSGIFEDVLRAYGVTLNVGRGYDSWDAINNAAVRYLRRRAPVTILYFSDFDPSGEDMARSLRDRLAELGSVPEIVKCALTAEDISRYNLPPNKTKPTDSRARAYVAKHGNVTVELDALPVDVLRARIVAELESRLDLAALADVRRQEAADRRRLAQALGAVA